MSSLGSSEHMNIIQKINKFNAYQTAQSVIIMVTGRIDEQISDRR